MIKSRIDIINLLDAYLDAQFEWNYQFWMQGKEWSGERQATYSKGIVLGKFHESDASTMKILKLGVEDKALKHEIRLDIERDIKGVEWLAQFDFRYQNILDSQRRELEELHILSMDEWIAKNCGYLKEDFSKMSCSEIRVLIYLYYSFKNFNYEREHPYCNDVGKLETIYKAVLGKQSQFHKYGIIPIDENRELLSINLPRIYDKTINRTFFTKNVPLRLLQKISEMISEGIIGDFAVRLLNEPGYEGKMDVEYFTEDVERGKVFDFVDLGSYSVSKHHFTTF